MAMESEAWSRNDGRAEHLPITRHAGLPTAELPERDRLVNLLLHKVRIC